MNRNMVRQRAARCIRLLEEQYGIPQVEERDPVDLLMMTILSQNTSDTNSLRAFARLKSAFCDYEQVLAAADEAVAESIRAGGLAEIKARRIKEALFRIKKDAGAISLSFLADMNKEQAMAYLLSLPGVGPKTASVVLLFAFSMPFLPVDTHVYRVCHRLGLVSEAVAPEKAQSILERAVPVEKYLSFHLNLITHGRRICRARNPKHDGCALRDCCDYYLHGQKP
ncbi:MAG: G/T mismatches repair enzyme [Methanosaeta sp. PtaU1.Bin112]|nr:MAG: G/T mismatches repair enzyme [Methanosaeta sp. PtaU1.Bin112]